MKKDKKNDDAMNFLNSMRGHYIISQALYIAIEELDKVTDFKHRQTSNMQDMQYLQDNLFNMYPIAHEEKAAILEKLDIKDCPDCGGHLIDAEFGTTAIPEDAVSGVICEEECGYEVVYDEEMR